MFPDFSPRRREPRAILFLTPTPPPAETKEEKIARKITLLMMAECQIIKSDWFSELTEELEQAKKTIKEQNEALAKIREILPLK